MHVSIIKRVVRPAVRTGTLLDRLRRREHVILATRLGADRSGWLSFLSQATWDCCLLLIVAASLLANPLAAQEPPPAQVSAYRLVIPLPIVDEVDRDVKRAVTQVLERFEQESQEQEDRQRPLLVLEFRPREGTAGETSEFDRSFSLARFLASDALRQVRTVAYLPLTVKGHSLLPVLSCQQIVMAPDAQLGEAGITDEHVAPEVRLVYQEFSSRRRVIQPAVALGMLDRTLTVFEVKTPQGPRYVLAEELEQLKQAGEATESRTVIPAGDMGLFTGRQLRLEFGFVSHLVSNETELAEALEIPAGLLRRDPGLSGTPRPIRIDLEGRISRQKVARLKNEIRDQVENKGVNFLCLGIDSPGGSLTASIDLASTLKDLDASKVKTVAFVEQALGDAALLALACDEILMAPDARLGGPGDYQPSRSELKGLEETLQPIAAARGRSWSLMKAMVDPKLPVFSYEHKETGEIRYLCADEHTKLEKSDAWVRQQKLKLAEGLSAEKARALEVSRKTVQNVGELKELYQLPEQLEIAETPRLTQMLDRLVAQPWFASTLLFFAFLFLMSEISAPGLGIPGFISALCFMLFFWAQFFNGTAGWLEILLFVSGVIFVGLEIFVVPGLGVFGIGGGIMIVGALIMASQTFIIPSNSYQVDVFVSSLFNFVMASGGVIVVIWGMVRFFPDNFWFRQVVLPALSAEELEAQERREEMVSWDHLLGETGMTATALVPAGKVRIGHKLLDVISDGDMIEKGIPVSVVEVKGNRVVVRAVESP